MKQIVKLNTLDMSWETLTLPNGVADVFGLAIWKGKLFACSYNGKFVTVDLGSFQVIGSPVTIAGNGVVPWNMVQRDGYAYINSDNYPNPTSIFVFDLETGEQLLPNRQVSDPMQLQESQVITMGPYGYSASCANAFSSFSFLMKFNLLSRPPPPSVAYHWLGADRVLVPEVVADLGDGPVTYEACYDACEGQYLYFNTYYD